MDRPEAGPEAGQDAVEFVFPSGVLSVAANACRQKSQGSGKRNVAKGDYGVKLVSPPKKSRPTRSVQPPRTPFKSGICKLVEASARYHPHTYGTVKQGFQGGGLTALELRDTLRRFFGIKLTDPELSAVFAHFVPDGGMELDGNLFIIHFLQVK